MCVSVCAHACMCMCACTRTRMCAHAGAEGPLFPGDPLTLRELEGTLETMQSSAPTVQIEG